MASEKGAKVNPRQAMGNKTVTNKGFGGGRNMEDPVSFAKIKGTSSKKGK